MQIKHVYRESNRVADALAKSSLALAWGVHVLDEPSLSWSRVLQMIGKVASGRGKFL